MSLFDRASAIASTLASKAKAAAMNVSEIEMKVLEATNLDPWGPHGTLMGDIARAAYNPSDYALIMAVLEQRLVCTGAQWRHVYKSLLVLEYMAKLGPMRAVEYLRASQSMLTRLNEDFAYRDENGRDQGINVRERAKHIMALVTDDARLKAERDKASKNAGKYTGVSSSGGSYSGPSSPRQPQVARRSGEDDPMEATRQRIERLKADGALPDPPAAGAGDAAAEGEPAPKPKKKLSEVRVNPAISAAISSMPIAPSSLSTQPSYTASPAAPAPRVPSEPSPLDLLSDIPVPAPSSTTAAQPSAAAAPVDDDWSNFAAAPAAAQRPKIDVDAMLNLGAPAPAAGGALPLEAFSALPPAPSRGAFRPPAAGTGAGPVIGGAFGQPPLAPTAPVAAQAPVFDPFAPSLAAAPAPFMAPPPPPAAAAFDPFAPAPAAVPLPPAAAAFDPFAPSASMASASRPSDMPLTADALLKPSLPAAPKPKLGPETAAQKRKNDPFADLLSL